MQLMGAGMDGRKRNRIKLNMLEPGCKMCRISGILLILAGVCYVFGLQSISLLVLCCSILIFVVLLILVRIELYQDNKDYLKYKKEDKNIN